MNNKYFNTKKQPVYDCIRHDKMILCYMARHASIFDTPRQAFFN